VGRRHVVGQVSHRRESQPPAPQGMPSVSAASMSPPSGAKGMPYVGRGRVRDRVAPVPEAQRQGQHGLDVAPGADGGEDDAARRAWGRRWKTVAMRPRRPGRLAIIWKPVSASKGPARLQGITCISLRRRSREPSRG
jgi:hypothetical protein